MDWKDHPLAIATITCAATATFMVVVVIPIWTQSKDNEIATLRTQPTQLRAELKRVTDQLAMIEKENMTLRRQVDKLSPDEMFSVDDAYPKAFRSVRIGDRVEVINEAFGKDADIKR